jgi:hypothetical protein
VSSFQDIQALLASLHDGHSRRRDGPQPRSPPSRVVGNGVTLAIPAEGISSVPISACHSHGVDVSEEGRSDDDKQVVCQLRQTSTRNESTSLQVKADPDHVPCTSDTKP